MISEKSKINQNSRKRVEKSNKKVLLKTGPTVGGQEVGEKVFSFSYLNSDWMSGYGVADNKESIL